MVESNDTVVVDWSSSGCVQRIGTAVLAVTLRIASLVVCFLAARKILYEATLFDSGTKVVPTEFGAFDVVIESQRTYATATMGVLHLTVFAIITVTVVRPLISSTVCKGVAVSACLLSTAIMALGFVLPYPSITFLWTIDLGLVMLHAALIFARAFLLARIEDLLRSSKHERFVLKGSKRTRRNHKTMQLLRFPIIFSFGVSASNALLVFASPFLGQQAIYLVSTISPLLTLGMSISVINGIPAVHSMEEERFQKLNLFNRQFRSLFSITAFWTRSREQAAQSASGFRVDFENTRF
ncbi:hypothetical protein QR680_012091 [Steinernema hermaphroditum]|uniref:Uncharacterized protein n=1 Tax=Steinernema hermaphroditum TaxID=289476 RepID=A0AA39I0V6_9BILA|nr:hypothetical protein QR680_012091 [Steinernema hermaphroditum]